MSAIGSRSKLTIHQWSNFLVPSLIKNKAIFVNQLYCKLTSIGFIQKPLKQKLNGEQNKRIILKNHNFGIFCLISLRHVIIFKSNEHKYILFLRRNMFHSDIRPANILMTEENLNDLADLEDGAFVVSICKKPPNHRKGEDGKTAGQVYPPNHHGTRGETRYHPTVCHGLHPGAGHRNSFTDNVASKRSIRESFRSFRILRRLYWFSLLHFLQVSRCY